MLSGRLPLLLLAVVAATALGVAAALVAVVSRSESGSPARVSGGPRAAEAERGCTATDVRGVVLRFVRAFNDGDVATLDGVFARAGEFHWYTVDDPARPRDLGAEDRSALLRYLGRRHRAGERLRLVSFAFNGNNASYGHFEFEVDRSAGDLATTRYDGKGAVVCTDGPPRIAAWAMGRDAR